MIIPKLKPKQKPLRKSKKSISLLNNSFDWSKDKTYSLTSSRSEFTACSSGINGPRTLTASATAMTMTVQTIFLFFFSTFSAFLFIFGYGTIKWQKECIRLRPHTANSSNTAACLFLSGDSSFPSSAAITKSNTSTFLQSAITQHAQRLPKMQRLLPQRKLLQHLKKKKHPLQQNNKTKNLPSFRAAFFKTETRSIYGKHT